MFQIDYYLTFLNTFSDCNNLSFSSKSPSLLLILFLKVFLADCIQTCPDILLLNETAVKISWNDLWLILT